MQDTKSIAETFRDGTVFLTGGTGFLGKILVEKLLRSCPVKDIAVLVRNKKGVEASKRVADLFEHAFFDRLRRKHPDFMNRIKVIAGNLDESSMNLSACDRDWLIENVNFVFHCAATIKFNEPLGLATKTNVQGTENVMALAKEMTNLKGFVYVSTAYSHCPRDEIKEQFYSMPITNKELKNVLKNIDTDEPTTNIIGNWPNTYTFTKAVTENMILTNEHHLPISVFRPSIIGCTHSEPDPGWLENINGPSGVVTGVMVGFLRTIPVIGNRITDIVPADYSANALISVMWDTVNRYHNCDRTDEEPKIYNYVSSVNSPLTWERYIKLMNDSYYEAPPLQSIWCALNIFYSNLWLGSILRFGLHRVPAALVDLSLIVCGKRPKMLKMYAKTERTLDLLYTFTTRQWKFDNSNTRELWSSMSDEDRGTFPYSLDEFNWRPYIKDFYHGIRKHILHEDISNVTKAVAKNKKLVLFHRLSIFLVIFLLFQICLTIVKYLF